MLHTLLDKLDSILKSPNSGISYYPSPFSDDLSCPSTKANQFRVRPKPGNIYFSFSLVESG